MTTHYPKTQEEAVTRARDWLAREALFLDTETTGIAKNDEIIELCILDSSGKVLFNSLVKPTKPIPQMATAIHGITENDVHAAPSWPDVYNKIEAILANRLVIAYNCSFDSRLFRQTTNIYRLNPLNVFWQCAMITYAGFRGERTVKGRLKNHKLGVAALQMGLSIDTRLHRSKADTLLTLELVKGMAFWNSESMVSQIAIP